MTGGHSIFFDSVSFDFRNSRLPDLVIDIVRTRGISNLRSSVDIGVTKTYFICNGVLGVFLM